MEDPYSDILWYELEYVIDINHCQDDDMSQTVMFFNISPRHNYTLTNSTETPVEENSTYTIHLKAVNSDGQNTSNATVINTSAACKGKN